MNTKYALIHICKNISTLRNIVEISDNEQLIYYEMYRNLPQCNENYQKSGIVLAVPINKENEFIDILKSANWDNATEVKLMAYKYKDDIEATPHVFIQGLDKLLREMFGYWENPISHNKFNNIIRFLKCNIEELQKRIDDIIEFCVTNNCDIKSFNYYFDYIPEPLSSKQIMENKERIVQLANFHASIRTDNNISFIEEMLFFNMKEMKLRQRPIKNIQMSESLITTLKNIVFEIHCDWTNKEISLYEYFNDKTVKNFADELPLKNIKGKISDEDYKEIKEIIYNHHLVAEYEYRKNDYFPKLRLIQCQKQ